MSGDIEGIFRQEYGRADAVQDAFVTAMRLWPVNGAPPSPAGWVITTARNRVIDRLRREWTRTDRHV